MFSLMIFFSVAAGARGATYPVTNTNDVNPGSLRNAIASANSTNFDDTIIFSIPANDPNCTAGGVCTIKLTSGELVINSAATGGKLTITTISGASNLIIDGNNASRIFYLSSGGDLTLDGLTLTNGNGAGSQQSGFGGAILSAANLILTNSSVIGNNVPENGGCGGIASGGILTITNSVVRNNTSQAAGGGICNDGTLKMQNSTVSFNTSRADAAGILSGGSLGSNLPTATIKNSTINNNTTQLLAGCAGLENFRGVLTIENSTVSNNTGAQSGGGICHFSGTLTINNSTISGNSAPSGGGILASQFSSEASNTYIRNSIVAANTGTNGQPDINKSANAIFTSRGNNLIGNSIDTGTAITWNILPGMTDILNQAPQLAPLADNGGVQTQALLVNSPAINTGNNCVLNFSGCGANDPATGLTLDERGYYRSGAVDIGAFEYNGTARKTSFDFDGERKADYSVFRPSDRTWYLERSTAGLAAAQFGLASDKLAPADYDGDGKTDIAVWRESAGNFYIFNSSNNSIRIENFGLTGDVLTVGDWDGDGKADLSVYRNAAVSSQSYFYYRGSLNNPSGNITYLAWGTTGDKPLRGDFDGDGKQDAAVYRGANQTWYINNSSNNQVQFITFGLSSDKFVQADYDGDGKTDAAVYRPGNGVWYILQSSNNQVNYVRFGVSTDTPVPADYDGDGKVDVAVYRDGQWIVQQSTNNQLIYHQFGLTGDAPVPAAFAPQ